MKRKISTRIAAALAVAVAGALLAGCSTPTSGGKDSSGDTGAWKPSKTINLYVGYAPGGSGDTIARELALLMSKDWNVSISVQNRPGASGAEATMGVLQSKPDGHAIAVAPASQLTVTPLISSDALPFKDANDWTTINGILDQQNGLLANSKSGWKNIQDFIKAAKANPGKLTVGVPSVAGANAMAVASLEKVAGIKVKIVPFSGGSGESSVALLGGQIDAICATLSGQLGLIQSGDLVSLGHTGDEPYTPAASTPLSKQGYAITSLANSVYYMYGPKGMKANVLAAYQAEMDKVLKSAEFTKWLDTNGYNSHPTNAAESKSELLGAGKDAAEGVALLTSAGLDLSQKK